MSVGQEPFVVVVLNASLLFRAYHVAAAAICQLHSRRVGLELSILPYYGAPPLHFQYKYDSASSSPDADDAAEGLPCGSDRIVCLDYWFPARNVCRVYERPNQSGHQCKLRRELILGVCEMRLAEMRPCGYFMSSALPLRFHWSLVVLQPHISLRNLVRRRGLGSKPGSSVGVEQAIVWAWDPLYNCWFVRC